MGILEDAINGISRFSTTTDLTRRISDIESKLVNKKSLEVTQFLAQEGIEKKVFDSALKIKELAGQIHVLIHAVGILIALPRILEHDETIKYLSLGAGNTGKEFDLETDKRIAEFKFIQWKGGPESIRQNSIFIDLFNLAEYETAKKRYLYVVEKEYPLRFFNGNRAIESILSKNHAVRQKFYKKYVNKYKTVSEFFKEFKHLVNIIDLNDI